MSELIPLQPSSPSSIQYIEEFTQDLTTYLTKVGLPCQNVLVEPCERGRVIANLPGTLALAKNYKTSEAMYLSKMVAACAVGLFDAAINFLWDETIANLRYKVSIFDLQYFFATAIPDEKQRKHFIEEKDLKKIDDYLLIRTCCEVGLISEIAYKHLDYIREIRNHASAAHPNQNDITGLQLASCIETCIKEVLSKEPDGSLIEIGRLLKNIREETFTKESAKPVCAAIQKLPQERVSSFARSVFGMYFDLSSKSNTKNNIQILAESIWQTIDEQTKLNFGLKYTSFSVHGETERAALVRDILQRVNGLSYLTEDTRAFELQDLLERLHSAHNNFNNFYTEGPIAKLIEQYIPSNGKIPDSIRSVYVKIITVCYIGTTYGYSWEAEEIYSRLISQWGDKETLTLCSLLTENELSSRFQFSRCANRFRELLNQLNAKASNLVLKDLLTYILSCNDKALETILRDSRYKEKLKNIRI
ncbi:MAG: hypothetical protein IKP58_11495 [Victivallales bacterium]|nr:hypothetical protein [Victivallales bacterium]